jgi:hypothetical protein
MCAQGFIMMSNTKLRPVGWYLLYDSHAKSVFVSSILTGSIMVGMSVDTPNIAAELFLWLSWWGEKLFLN